MTLDQITAFEFFRDFSRFEYALKRAGFYRHDRNNAEPNWTCFSESAPVKRVLDDPVDTGLKEAIQHILNHPPRKQVVENGGLAWSDQPPDATSQSGRVLGFVCRVRNNLFHGEKQFMLLGGSGGGSDRDKKLIEAGIEVLRYCKEILGKEKNLGTDCS